MRASILSIRESRSLPSAPSALAKLAPLVVDLDGTLLRVDLLYESLVVLAKQHPWCLLLLPLWALRGKAYFKQQLAEKVMPDIATLPVNDALLAWLLEEKAKGRELHLASASDERLVRRVADRFGIFDWVRGSNGGTNLAGAAKLAAIEARLGPRFTYAGDSRRDLMIWEKCRSAVLVGNTAQLRDRLSPDVEVVHSFDAKSAGIGSWLRALRVHQWSKNALLFVPLLLSGSIRDGRSIVLAAVAFVAFCLLASATYLVNDLLDVAADRLHRSKKQRPFASGALPLRSGLVAIPLLIAAAAALTVFEPPHFAAVALFYLVMTLAYSLRVKQMLMLDVIVLAILYTVRILAGIAAISSPLSQWLLAFSMFFFLSLGCMKRYSEGLVMLAEGQGALPGRGYQPADVPWLMAMGAASGFCAMATFFIFLVVENSPLHSYAHPQWMWLICVMLGYWLSRAWALAGRGEMNDDPVIFAVKDRTSLLLGGIIVVTMLLAALR